MGGGGGNCWTASFSSVAEASDIRTPASPPSSSPRGPPSACAPTVSGPASATPIAVPPPPAAPPPRVFLLAPLPLRASARRPGGYHREQASAERSRRRRPG